MTTTAMKDPYAILGVSKSATAEEIRKAYRKLAKELHPDTRPDDKAAEERFKEVGQAFKLLSDPETRAKYDRGEIDAEGNERAPFHYRSRPGAGASQRGPSGRFEDLGDIFSDLFGEFGQGGPGGGRRRGPPPMRGADVRGKVEISFEEAIKGGKRRVSAPGGRALDVAIPAGVEDGQVLRLKGQGGQGQAGGPAGDALVEVRIRSHPWFRRDGDAVRVDLPISIKEAVLGAKVRAPTVDGPVEVRVPAGSSSGALLRLRGKGAPKASGGRGDQIIRLLVDVPTDDAELERFAETWTPPAGYDPRKRFRR
ncbi:molecular chaperone DnaJ [Marinicauda salina]|uniref:Molecular chaperone DnaJ n=1 Tax=Marinicauda salina TaxID=2135793 RepID=A0A2U2BSQ6_9PROT|nr:J domain-containing protein [Marinicauda salina]PWE17026.1 molecular chaperone DnaJ [Marinicauda salina]